MTAVELAIDECRKVAASLAKLGRAGTSEEIAKVHGLPRDLVNRRLRGSSTSNPLVATRYFWFDNVSRTWGLTQAGRDLAKGSRASANSQATPS
jgi:hypothetical protein